MELVVGRRNCFYNISMGYGNFGRDNKTQEIGPTHKSSIISSGGSDSNMPRPISSFIEEVYGSGKLSGSTMGKDMGTCASAESCSFSPEGGCIKFSMSTVQSVMPNGKFKFELEPASC
jgi:hypothetical protein